MRPGPISRHLPRWQAIREILFREMAKCSAWTLHVDTMDGFPGNDSFNKMPYDDLNVKRPINEEYFLRGRR